MFDSFPILCCPERWTGLNRISHPDWVKLCVDANGRIKLRAKQKYEILSGTSVQLIPFSFQALFSQVSSRGDPSRCCLVSPHLTPSVLLSSSPVGLFTFVYTAVSRTTRNFLIPGVMAIKRYSIFPNDAGLKPHDMMG